MQVVYPAPNRSLGTIDVLGIVGLIGLFVARFIPVAVWIPFWGCTFREWTGIPCPGCGLTRAADRFAHFNVLGALAANPLGTVAAAGFGLAAVASVVHLAFKVPLPELILSENEWRWVRWVAVSAFVVNYVFVILAHRLWHIA